MLLCKLENLDKAFHLEHSSYKKMSILPASRVGDRLTKIYHNIARIFSKGNQRRAEERAFI